MDDDDLDSIIDILNKNQDRPPPYRQLKPLPINN